jgi:hypothetical protein
MDGHGMVRDTTGSSEDSVNRLVKTSLLALVVTAGTATAQPTKPGTKPALTQEQYEKLVLAYTDCKLNGYEIDGKCPAVKALQDAQRDTTTPIKDMLGMSAKLGEKLIVHPSPAVRVKAAQLMGSLTGTATSSQDVVVAAAEKEKDPQVLQAFIRTVWNDGAKNPKVAAFLIKMADHAEKDVRLQAVYALSSSWNKDMKGGPEKLAKVAQNDKEPKVRQAACEYGGKLGHKAMIAVLDKFTNKADDKDMYAACMKGIVAMFFQYPFYETTSQEAYKLFIKRLGMTPRNVDSPPWTVMSEFEKYGDEKNEKLAAWKKKATWFKEAEMRKALSAIVADKKTNWMARTGAVKSLIALGATKAELETLLKGYDEKNFDDKHVHKAITEAITKGK